MESNSKSEKKKKKHKKTTTGNELDGKVELERKSKLKHVEPLTFKVHVFNKFIITIKAL